MFLRASVVSLILSFPHPGDRLLKVSLNQFDNSDRDTIGLTQ